MTLFNPTTCFLTIERRNKMRKRIEYLILPALVAFLAIPLVAHLRRSGATTAADFDAEVRQIEAFATDLGKYQDQIILLNKKRPGTTDEAIALARERDSLKGRLAGVEQAFRAIAAKLKTDGRWEGLDAAILRGMTDSKAKRLIAQGGGATKILEDTENLLNSVDEISSLITPAPSASARESSLKIIAASYDLPPIFFRDSLGCKLARGELVLTNAKPGSRVAMRAWCLCVEMPALPDETLAECMAINTTP
jgi:cell division protein FtsB